MSSEINNNHKQQKKTWSRYFALINMVLLGCQVSSQMYCDCCWFYFSEYVLTNVRNYERWKTDSMLSTIIKIVRSTLRDGTLYLSTHTPRSSHALGPYVRNDTMTRCDFGYADSAFFSTDQTISYLTERFTAVVVKLKMNKNNLWNCWGG